MLAARDLLRAHLEQPVGAQRAPGLLASAEGRNPLCGDEVRIALDGSVGVVEVSWNGRGCALTRASASVLVEMLSGVSLDAAQRRFTAAVALLDQDVEIAMRAPEPLDQVWALSAVIGMPSRRRCQMLSWRTWEDAAAQVLTPSSADRQPWPRGA